MKLHIPLSLKIDGVLLRLPLAVVLVALLLFGTASHTVAQFGQSNVTVTHVDSRNFPQVSAFVTVADQNGLPVTDLTAANFVIVEDGVPITPDSVVIEPFNMTERYLVLAIDVSTYADILPQIQAAARTFIQNLGPSDRVSILALYDDAEILTEFTNNSNTLLAAIDGLKLKGDFTALNAAVEETAGLVESFPVGHRALIILPDSKNNISPREASAAISRVQQAGVPLYLIGVKTNKIEPQDLEAYATQTSGKVTVVPPAQVEAELLDIARRLPYGYRVTYQSKLPADNQPHELTLAVNTQGRAGETASQFVAFARPVTVSLLGVTQGQTVGGVIDLSVAVQAPAPLAGVTYAVEGQAIATVTSPPFSTRWDTTQVAPGSYAVTATASDTAGNEGEAGVNLNIVPPVTVAVSSLTTAAAVGDEITLQATVATLEALNRVDLLLNDRVIESRAAPPYSFVYNSQSATPGVHTFTIRATDQLNRAGQASLAIEFFPAWKERLRLWLGIEDRAEFEAWLQFVKKLVIIGAAVMLILLLFILAFLLLAAIRRNQLARMVQHFGLAVVNLGNSASSYVLWATDEANALEFSFMLNGQKLQAPPPLELFEPEETETYFAAPVAAPVQSAQPVQAQPGAATKAAAPPAAKSQSDLTAAKEQASKAAESGHKAMGVTVVIGDMLNGIAKILPRSLGAPLQSAANQMRMQRAQIQQATRIPQQIVKTTRNVKRQAATITPKGVNLQSQGASKAVAAPQTKTVAMAAPAGPMVSTPVEQPANGRSKTRPVAKIAAPPTTQPVTPAIFPGETVIIDVLITPVNPYKRASYPFTVLSAPLDHPEAAPTSAADVAEIRGILWLARIMPAIFIFLVTLFIAFLIAVVAGWLIELDLIGAIVQFSCTISGFWPGSTGC